MAAIEPAPDLTLAKTAAARPRIRFFGKRFWSWPNQIQPMAKGNPIRNYYLLAGIRFYPYLHSPLLLIIKISSDGYSYQ